MAQFKVIIASCYGAANTGQLAGAAATELVNENDDYHLVCLPAVAIDKDTGLNKVKGAALFVIIEGCPVMCCSKIVEEHAGRKPDLRFEMVEDFGVKKAPVLVVDEQEKERVKGEINARIEEELASRGL